MKKKLLFFVLPLIALLSFVACGDDDEDDDNNTQTEKTELKELFKLTDKYVDKLSADLSLSYGILDAQKHEEYTPDKAYKVMPTGRLVNVRIEHVATDEEYEDLRLELEDHYKNYTRVNKVYRANAGTLMIDCRR